MKWWKTEYTVWCIMVSVVVFQCPKCQVCIEKNGGCNHMQCSKCKHDFCWMCLGGTTFYFYLPAVSMWTIVVRQCRHSVLWILSKKNVCTLCPKKSMWHYLFEHNSNINCPIIIIFGTVVTEIISYWIGVSFFHLTYFEHHHPLKISAKVAVGVLRDSRKFSGRSSLR